MAGQQDPVLLLDVSTLQGPDLHLDVYTQQGPGLHLEMSRQHEPVLLLDVSTPQGLELHLDVSIPQRPVLLLDVSGQQEPVLQFEQIETMFFSVCTNNLTAAENWFKDLYIHFSYVSYCLCTHFMFKGFLNFTCHVQSYLD